MNKKKTLLICLIILLVGGAVIALIFLTEPSAARGGATKETAMLVEVTEAEKGTYQPTIVATGTVQPSKDIILSPRVSGEIIRQSQDFVPGGFVSKGDVLLQIDPSDYKNILKLRKSDLSQALADLNVEQGRQKVAQMDYELIDPTLSEENKELVLREPQLNAIRARVEAARAAVEQAELQVQRTVIRAPFDAHILSRNVNIGSQVAPGDVLGRLVGRDVYWVVVTIPISKLRWLSFPENEEEKGSEVKIMDQKAWQEGAFRTGYLFRLVGALEDQTRMARVIMAVPDPLAYRSESENEPRLMINSFVEVSIQGNPIQDVIRLSRDFVRQNETVWVMEDGKLQIRDVNIVLSDSEYAYIDGGLQEEDQVVKTNLSTVAEGLELRLQESDSLPEQDPQSKTAQQN